MIDSNMQSIAGSGGGGHVANSSVSSEEAGDSEAGVADVDVSFGAFFV